jgi:DNA-directed RNA polymerase sigma subunit (sigma70/sigma32)
MNDADESTPEEYLSEVTSIENDEDGGPLGLSDLDTLLRMDIEVEPQSLEPDAADDTFDTFDEIAGEWFAVGAEDDDGPSEDVLLAAHAKLRSLTESQRTLVELHFGFGDEEPMSIREIAEHFDLNEQHVSKMISGALKRMRDG